MASQININVDNSKAAGKRLGLGNTVTLQRTRVMYHKV